MGTNSLMDRRNFGKTSLAFCAGAFGIFRGVEAEEAGIVKEGRQWTSEHWPVDTQDHKLVHVWVCDCRDPNKESPPFFDGIAFSPDGKRYATRDDVGSLVLWDSASQTKLRVFEKPIALRKEKQHIWFTLPFAFSPDGKQIAAGEPIRKQVPGMGNWVEGLHHGAAPRAWDVDWVAKDFSQGHVHVWDVETGCLVHQLPYPERGFPDVAIGAHTILAFAGPLRVWDRVTGRELPKPVYKGAIDENAPYPGPQSRSILTGTMPNSTRDTGDYVGIAPDALRLVTVENFRRVRCRDALKNRCFEYTLDPIRHFALRPDGLQFAAIDSAGPPRDVMGDIPIHILIFDVDRGTILKKFPASFFPNSLCYSPDGRRIVAANADGQVSVTEVESGKLWKFNDGPKSAVRAVVVLPKSIRVASGGCFELKFDLGARKFVNVLQPLIIWDRKLD